jgi:hypothetical protein
MDPPTNQLEVIAMKQQPAALWSDGVVETRWDKKPGFMSDLRARGQGPRFLRLSKRTVRYRPEDVEAYEKAQEFGSIVASLASDFTAPAADSQPDVAEHPQRKQRFMVGTALRQKCE